MDDYSRTNVPSIWAVGDVTDRMQLTPVALMEGMALARTLVLNEPTKPNHMAVPSAVFSYPELATVVSGCLALPRSGLLQGSPPPPCASSVWRLETTSQPHAPERPPSKTRRV